MLRRQRQDFFRDESSAMLLAPEPVLTPAVVHKPRFVFRCHHVAVLSNTPTAQLTGRSGGAHVSDERVDSLVMPFAAWWLEMLDSAFLLVQGLLSGLSLATLVVAQQYTSDTDFVLVRPPARPHPANATATADQLP